VSVRARARACALLRPGTQRAAGCLRGRSGSRALCAAARGALERARARRWCTDIDGGGGGGGDGGGSSVINSKGGAGPGAVVGAAAIPAATASMSARAPIVKKAPLVFTKKLFLDSGIFCKGQ